MNENGSICEAEQRQKRMHYCLGISREKYITKSVTERREREREREREKE